VFPVKIAKEESVGTLKKEIKKEKKPDFDHIPADKLILWKVSLRTMSNMSSLISLGRFPSLRRIVRRYSKDVKTLTR
jgi:hypothetical protein